MKFLTKKHEIKNGIISAEKRHLKGDYSEHGHEFFEIEYVTDGSGLYIIDGREYKIEKGMLFFMSPADFHKIVNSDAEIINVMFSCNLCDNASLYRLFAKSPISAIKLSESDFILTEKLLSEMTESSDTEYIIQFLQCVLMKISKLASTKNHESPALHSYIKSAIIYMLENFRANLSLSGTACYLGLAPAYLSSLFLKETGVNFKAYLDNIRFEYAQKLLSSKNLTVLQVCNASGFSDYTNFTRRFKKRYGISPSEYKKRL